MVGYGLIFLIFVIARNDVSANPKMNPKKDVTTIMEPVIDLCDPLPISASFSRRSITINEHKTESVLITTDAIAMIF